MHFAVHYADIGVIMAATLDLDLVFHGPFIHRMGRSRSPRV